MDSCYPPGCKRRWTVSASHPWAELRFPSIAQTVVYCELGKKAYNIPLSIVQGVWFVLYTLGILQLIYLPDLASACCIRMYIERTRAARSGPCSLPWIE